MTTSSPTATASASVTSRMPDVVTIAEAATLLRCKPWDVYVRVLDGTLAAEPSCTCERGPWLIRRDDLERVSVAS